MKKIVIQQGGTPENGYRIRVDMLPVIAKSGVSRGERRIASTLLRERQNDVASWLKLELLLYENFSLDDWLVELTYREEDLPPSWKAAKKNPPAFLRQIREARKMDDLPYGYIYVHEGLHGDHRKHHHLVIKAADGNKDLIDRAWKRGFVNIDTIQDFGGFHKVATYITKEPREKGKPVVGERMWTPSKGLKKPDRHEIIVEDNYIFHVPPDMRPVDDGLAMESKVPGWIYGEFPRWDMIGKNPIT